MGFSTQSSIASPTSRLSGGGLDYITSSTFSAAATVSVNNCFTSTYDNYYVTVSTTTGTTGQDNRLRLRVGGVDDSTASSYIGQSTIVSGATVIGQQNTADYWRFGNSQASKISVTTVVILSPFAAVQTGSMIMAQASGAASYFEGGYHTAATSFDGFTFYPVTGTITGTVTVYGYRKA